MAHPKCPDLWLFNLRRTCAIPMKNKALQYLFWWVHYRYNRGTCGKWNFSTTHGDKRKERLWSPFLFSHMWDNIDWTMMTLGQQRHVPLWNAAPGSITAHRNLIFYPFGCFEGPTWKLGKHESLQKGCSFSLGFLSFLVGTIRVSAVNYLQVHFCTMQWSSQLASCRYN